MVSCRIFEPPHVLDVGDACSRQPDAVVARGLVEHRVVACTAGEEIAASAAIEPVVAGATGEKIVAQATAQCVVAVSAEDEIVIPRAGDVVIGATGREQRDLGRRARAVGYCRRERAVLSREDETINDTGIVVVPQPLHPGADVVRGRRIDRIAVEQPTGLSEHDIGQFFAADNVRRCR